MIPHSQASPTAVFDLTALSQKMPCTMIITIVIITTNPDSVKIA